MDTIDRPLWILGENTAEMHQIECWLLRQGAQVAHAIQGDGDRVGYETACRAIGFRHFELGNPGLYTRYNGGCVLVECAGDLPPEAATINRRQPYASADSLFESVQKLQQALADCSKVDRQLMTLLLWVGDTMIRRDHARSLLFCLQQAGCPVQIKFETSASVLLASDVDSTVEGLSQRGIALSGVICEHGKHKAGRYDSLRSEGAVCLAKAGSAQELLPYRSLAEYLVAADADTVCAAAKFLCCGATTVSDEVAVVVAKVREFNVV